MKRKKSGYCWWAAPVAGLMLVILFAAGLYVSGQVQNYRRYREMRDSIEGRTFYEGLYIDGISLAGATYEQAVAHWADNVEAGYQNRTVTVTVDGKTESLIARDYGYESDYISALNQAFAVGREGTVRERYGEIQSVRANARDFAVNRRIIDEALVRARVSEMAASVESGASEARVTGFNVETRTFTFAEGQAGYAIDQSRLLADVLAAFQSGGGAVEAQATLIQPTTTVSEMQEKYGEITVAVTNASSSSSNRISNIQLALNTLQGLCLQPGETFSFNGVLGKRTTDKGYKKAPAYVNGLVEEDVGGGICQVSTTLFNAAVKADLTVLERNAHSRPVAYVDLGKDAAVNWPDTDLKFRNDSDAPVYIVTELTENKRVRISVYGKLFENGGSIEVQAKKTRTLEPGEDRYVMNDELPISTVVLAEEAREGYEAEAYKVYLDANGAEIRREPLCKSRYNASGAVYHVGGGT